jgi:hypothetical protein
MYNNISSFFSQQLAYCRDAVLACCFRIFTLEEKALKYFLACDEIAMVIMQITSS